METPENRKLAENSTTHTVGVFWGAVFFVVIGLIIYFDENKEFLSILTNRNGVPSFSAPNSELAWVEFDFGSGKKRLFEGEVDQHIYPLKAVLASIADDKNIPLEVQDGKIGKIADVKDENGSWNIYRNGQMVEEHIDRIIITGGDHYTVKYEEKK